MEDILRKLNEICERLTRIEQTKEDEKAVLTMDELCKYTGYSEAYVYRLTSGRKIPYYKNGNKLFFHKPEIVKWLLGNKVKTTDEIEQEAQTYCVTH